MPRPVPAPRRPLPGAGLRRAGVALALVALGCSAPDIDDMPGRSVPAPPPEATDPLGPPRPAPPPVAPAPAPAPAPAAPPAAAPALVPTPETDFGPPPYTAWTATAPLSPVGPGGQPAFRLRRLGVRVEVAQTLPARTRMRCTGCTGSAEGAEAWVQPGRLRVAGGHGERSDPLVVALGMRARWAASQGLPPGFTRELACLLIDRGFALAPADPRGGPPVATWSAAGAELVLAWEDGAWVQRTIRPPTESPAWSCRTSRATPLDAP